MGEKINNNNDDVQCNFMLLHCHLVEIPVHKLTQAAIT